MNLKHPRIVPLALLAAFLLSAPAHAQFFKNPDTDLLRTNPKFLKAFKEAVAKPSASTVRIQCDGKDTALGMVVGPDGWILTKANDLRGEITVKLKDGTTHEARWVGAQQQHDVALLKIEASGLKPIEFTESKQVGVGNWLACVGTGDDPVAVGVVSVATRTLPKGGAMSFVPVNAKSGYLGVELEDGESHPLIKNVQEGTPAFKVGLKTKDIVLALNGAKMSNLKELQEAIGKNKPGDVVTIKVRRGDVELELKPTLDRRPLMSMRGEMQNRMGSELSSRISGYPTILQHDSVVKPADCGGPIVDLEGRVIGINICRAGRTESWAVPSEVIQPLLFDMMAGKLPPKQEAVKLTLEQQLAAARKALQRAEDQKATAEKKLAELKTQVAKLEADVKAAAKPAETASGDKPMPAVTPSPVTPSPKENAGAVEAEKVLELMKQRLHLMKDVAGAKWQTKQTDTDTQRETELLAELVRQGEKLGLSADVVRTFFVAQFDAAKQVQQSFFDRFQTEKAELKNVPDLRKDLRPKLDQVSQSLLTELGKLQPHLANPAVQQRLRGRAAAVLTGEGITEAIRNRALEPLLKK